MIVDRDATEVILLVKLVDLQNVAITGVAHNDASLALEYMQPGDTGFSTLSLVAGTLGTYISASWVEVGGGIYQFCAPDTFVVAGKYTTIKITYDIYDPWYDTVMATGNAGEVTIDMAQATPGGSTTGAQLDNIQEVGSTSGGTDTSGTGNSTAQWPTASVTTDVEIDGTYYSGDHWQIEFTGFTEDIPTTEYLYFSIKTDPDTEVDSDADLQASRLLSSGTTNLNFLNGAVPTDPVNMTATITWSSYVSGSDTLYKAVVDVSDTATNELAAGTYIMDLKRVGAFSRVLVRNKISISTPVTRAFS